MIGLPPEEYVPVTYALRRLYAWFVARGEARLIDVEWRAMNKPGRVP